MSLRKVVAKEQPVGRMSLEPGLNSKHMMFLFNQNVDILKDPETVRQLGSILKTNVRACKAVGHPFVLQLGRIYLDMLNVYKCLSENISSAVQSNGETWAHDPRTGV